MQFRNRRSAARGLRGAVSRWARLQPRIALEGLGEALRLAGELDRARSVFIEAGGDLLRLGALGNLAKCLEGLAAIATTRGRTEAAAWIAGVVGRVREEAGTQPWRPGRLPSDPPPDELARGRDLTAKAVLEYARNSLD